MKFSIIKNGIPILVCLPIVFFITVCLIYLFETFFWIGLLVYFPLYAIYKKTSYTRNLTDII